MHRRWVPEGTNTQITHAAPSRKPQNSQQGLVGYVAKITDHEATIIDSETGEVLNLYTYLGLDRWSYKWDENTPPVPVTRYGVSHSLGKKARSAAAFTSIPDNCLKTTRISPSK